MAWITIPVDWVNVFPQAILAEPLFMQMPRGFLNRYGINGCLKLTRSRLYRLEQTDGICHMSQKGLIIKIIKTVKMTDYKPNWTPTTQVALGSNP